MTAQDGINFLLKIGAVAGSPVTIAAARTNAMAINNEMVEITNKDSAKFRTFLEGAGVKSLSLDIEGVLDKGGTSVTDFMQKAISNSIDVYSLFFNGGFTIEGSFQIESYNTSGDHNTEQTFTATLQSSGLYSLTTN